MMNRGRGQSRIDLTEIMDMLKEVDLSKLGEAKDVEQSLKKMLEFSEKNIGSAQAKAEALTAKYNRLESKASKYESDMQAFDYKVSALLKNIESAKSAEEAVKDLIGQTEEVLSGIKDVRADIRRREEAVAKRESRIEFIYNDMLSKHEDIKKTQDIISNHGDKIMFMSRAGTTYAKVNDEYVEVSPFIDVMPKRAEIKLAAGERVVPLGEKHAGGYKHMQVFVDGKLARFMPLTEDSIQLIEPLAQDALVSVFFVPPISIAKRGKDGEFFKIESLSATDVGLSEVENVSFARRSLNQIMIDEVKALITENTKV